MRAAERPHLVFTIGFNGGLLNCGLRSPIFPIAGFASCGLSTARMADLPNPLVVDPWFKLQSTEHGAASLKTEHGAATL